MYFSLKSNTEAAVKIWSQSDENCLSYAASPFWKRCIFKSYTGAIL